eukprot:TRINITY_DN12636_c0_g1_i3.p2 TRINITY_DN12636_c0_g1~~TRINITY_DN12636_c0_g1_i3.p2  ORF type:complete len:109 (-),score=24.18 TRINITY_DN12636_c0_g1_i3:131-457(-)
MAQHHFIIKWKGTDYDFDMPIESTVHQLKQHMELLTNVPINYQKLIGLVKGKMPGDHETLSSILPATSLSSGTTRCMMMGSPVEEVDRMMVDEVMARDKHEQEALYPH